MNYTPPQHADIRFRPSYAEIATFDIAEQYKETERAIFESRDGSEFVSRRMAEIELEAKLRKLTCGVLKWNYSGVSPSEQAIKSATSLGKTFIKFGLVPDAVTMSPEGGVAICFVRDQKYADVEVFNSGEILAVRYSSNDDPKAWAIESTDVASDATAKSLSEYLSA